MDPLDNRESNWRPIPDAGNRLRPNKEEGNRLPPEPEDKTRIQPEPEDKTRPPTPPGAEEGARLLAPEPLKGDIGREEARLGPPEPPVAPKNEVESKKPSSPWPVGIAHFTEIESERVSAGFRPHPTDGIPWLQSRGYRTVLYLRPPGSTDQNDRRLMEKYGLKFQSLEVGSAVISRELVDQFRQIVGSANNYPLFIYDKDGLLTGSMYYAYYRLHEQMPEDRARNKAVQLGLKFDGDEEAQRLWDSIRKLTGDSR